MGERKLFRYVIVGLLGVVILYILPFILAQNNFDINMLNPQNGIFTNEGFMISVTNTIMFLAIFVPIVVILGFVLAYMTEYLHFNFAIQLIIILPIAVPVLSVAGFFREVIYGQLINYVGGIYIVGIAYLWGCVGYTYLAFLISLKNRNKSIEEAAYIDGANTFITLFKIIIPSHTEALLLSIILSIYNALRIFKFTYAMFGEYPDYKIFMVQNFLYVKLKNLTLDTLMVSADLFLVFIFVLLVILLSISKKLKTRLIK